VKRQVAARREGVARWVSRAVGLFVLLTSAEASAIDPVDAPPDAGDFDALSTGTGDRHDHWAGTGRRAFVAGVYDVGLFYLQPGLSLGYGEPHHRWFGLSGSVNMSVSGGTGKLAIRGVAPHFDARLGVRYESPINQEFLAPQDVFTREDTELEDYGASRYLSIDAELAGNVPMPGGHLIAAASAYGVLGTPRDLFVFEEALKVVIDPPFLWRARLGYMAELPFGGEREHALRIGVAAEGVHNPERPLFVARVGPLVSLPLTCHLEMVAAAMLVAWSRDRLGLLGADFGEIALRYRWASGDPVPGFP
jgi:hypothetical protein